MVSSSQEHLLLEGVAYRSAKEDDMQHVYSLVYEEGWNPGTEAHLYLELTEGELLVGEYKGDIVSCLCFPKFGRFAWVGLYLCKPGFRGKGIGLKMWNTAFKQHVPVGLNVGLASVMQQTENYRKSGFTETRGLSVRHEALAASMASASLACPSSAHHPVETIAKITPDDTSLLNACIIYDKHVFPDLERENFLRKWLTSVPENAVFASLVPGGTSVTGFISVRPAAVSYRVGPLYADSTDTACALLQRVAQHVHSMSPTATISIDVPEGCHGDTLVSTFSMQPVFQCMMMYKGTPPQVVLEKEYGLLNWEISF